MLRALFRGHSRWEADVDAFVDGELDAAALVRFEAHRSGCDRCVLLVAEAHDAARLLRALPGFEAPRSFRISKAMIAPQSVQPANTRSTPVFFRGALAATALAGVAFAVSIVVGVVGDDGAQSRQSLSAASAEDSASNKAAAPVGEPRSASLTSGSQQDPSPQLFASTATPFVVPTPTVPPVSGASSGSGTGEIARPATSPQAPATGAQVLATTPAAGPGVAIAPDSSTPLGTGAQRSLATAVPQPERPGALSVDDQSTASILPRDERRADHDDSLRAIQFVLGALTVLAVVITVFAAGWRGRNTNS